jgi:hypothetical protein
MEAPMRSRFVCLQMAAGIVLFLPAAVQAGMPSVSISDWAALRIETLSFFLIMLLLSAAVVRWLWNILAVDFPKFPRLTYGKSLAGVILIGLILSVVLTMIAGSRELLTPGAWEKQGRLYKVVPPKEISEESSGNPVETPESDTARGTLPSENRKASLGKLFTVLSEYAAKHEGIYPNKEAAKEIDHALWEVPGTSGMRYLYVDGLTAKDSGEILAYEPELSDGERSVLMADGKIRSMKSEDIRRKLQREEKP